MQLRDARLCLDCEELHTEQRCPACASESFVFLTRWVPAEERRESRKPPRAMAPAEPPSRMTWVKRGAAGLAVLAATRFLWTWSRRIESREPDPGTKKIPGDTP